MGVSLSFHSLRDGLVSMLKAVGAPVSVAMEFARHDSRQMSEHDTTANEAMRRRRRRAAGGGVIQRERGRKPFFPEILNGQAFEYSCECILSASFTYLCK
ncbi:MAG: hypothetical protein JWM59_3280 [Verrucomicrobiales bacterium]|nr:hypothetical protein [Verrucomicrobiales bacterium]